MALHQLTLPFVDVDLGVLQPARSLADERGDLVEKGATRGGYITRREEEQETEDRTSTNSWAERYPRIRLGRRRPQPSDLDVDIW